MIILPSKQTKQWRTATNGDIFGDIVRSRNLDFNKDGYLSLAKKPIVLYTKEDDANFALPLVLLGNASLLYAITTDHAFSFDVTTSNEIAVTEITGGAPPTFGLQSDAVFYNGLLHASGTTSVHSLSGTNWTSRITGPLTSAYPHPLCVSEHQQFLAVGNGNTVPIYDTTYTLQTTLTIPSDHVVVWIRWRANMLYIGTRNIQGGDAKMYLWNGTGTAAQSGYGAQCDWIYSGCEYDSSIAIITSTGQLMRFNGGGFDELVNFPIYYSKTASWVSAALTSSLLGKVTSRGMIAKGKKLYINVDGKPYVSSVESISDNLLEQPSGLWVFDPKVGLYHKSGYGCKKYQEMQISSITSNALALPSAAVFETGDAVLVNSVSLSGIFPSPAYAIKVDSTHLKLALSPADAVANRSIPVSGPPGVGDNIIFETYRSVGATRVQRAGGVFLIQRLQPNSFLGNEIFFAGETYNNATSVTDVLMSLGRGRNVGSFTTPRMLASEVTDNFQKIFTMFKDLNITNHKIVIKYRISERFGLNTSPNFSSTLGFIYWQTASTFYVDTRYVDFKNVAVGDEVEVIEGVGAGYTGHITTIDTVSDPTYLITIDESMPDVVLNDTANIMVNNWTKWKTITTTDPKDVPNGFAETSLAKTSKYVQFKVELRGVDMDMEEFSVSNAQAIKYV